MRILGYLVVAILCFDAARRENDDATGTWPPFWILTGVLFVIMALGRAGDVADLMIEALRERARSHGWYDRRRDAQALVVAGLAIAWLICVLVAVLRVPARRRRYLPMIVVVLSLGFYAAIRIVSLHQLDSLLYRRHMVGVRDGTLIEFVLLFLAASCAVWTSRRRLDTDRKRRPTVAARDG
jgi:hypothetical protein